MFKIECFVTDKHLPDVLRALGQRVMNLTVVPVVDAAPVVRPASRKGEETKTLEATSASGLESFLKALSKAPAINRGSAAAACQEAGLNPSSAYYFLKRARRAGFLSSKGKGTQLTWSWARSAPTKGA